MIARNFIRFPEALRFQREMFSNGYHNSPRIMRLMECVFDWSATVPDWWKEAKGRARDLARSVKKSICDFFKDLAVKASDQLSLVFEAPRVPSTLNEELEARIVAAGGRDNYARPDLCDYRLSDIGRYQSFCHIGWNKFVGSFDYSFTYSADGRFPTEPA